MVYIGIQAISETIFDYLQKKPAVYADFLTRYYNPMFFLPSKILTGELP